MGGKASLFAAGVVRKADDELTPSTTDESDSSCDSSPSPVDEAAFGRWRAGKGGGSAVEEDIVGSDGRWAMVDEAEAGREERSPRREGVGRERPRAQLLQTSTCLE